MLAGKKILLAVSGSIAAYKTAFFVRLLVTEGAEVKVVMTKSATDFITPLTLATLSKHSVHTEFVKNDSGEWTNHVELGLWADVMIVAPASANTLAKMANGICDNLLLATYLSAKCPIFFAPAMDLDMHEHPATQTNIKLLQSRGNQLIASNSGELASGLHGPGRMAEPEELIEVLKNHFSSGPLFGKKILMTSGPTFEPIDAVRFIGNHSSGKMGKSIALALANAGAQVNFISGPVAHYPEHEQIRVTKVTSASEMFEAAKSLHREVDIAFFAAAVADYRPREAATSKMKRNGQSLNIELIENPDIALELGKQKKQNQIHIGFALETDNEQANAQKKREKKNFDMIVLNSLNDAGAGFAHDTNRVTIYDRDNKQHVFELKTKQEVAQDILNLVSQYA